MCLHIHTAYLLLGGGIVVGGAGLDRCQNLQLHAKVLEGRAVGEQRVLQLQVLACVGQLRRKAK